MNAALAVALGFPPDDDLSWQNLALCAETDPEAFYPEKGESTAPAKRICRRCPVAGECLAFALGNGERFGIWGGMSERERRRLPGYRANLSVTVCGTRAGFVAHRQAGEDACEACTAASRKYHQQAHARRVAS